MLKSSKKRNILMSIICNCGLMTSAATNAETTTTTTTTTNPDGTTTTTVEETTTSGEPEAAPQATTPNLVGPAGVTGTIRRSDRRQDRRDGDPRID